MLVNPGENYSDRRNENQVDCRYRVLEWFNFFVRGQKPPSWITEGVPQLERHKEFEAMNEEGQGEVSDPLSVKTPPRIAMPGLMCQVF